MVDFVTWSVADPLTVEQAACLWAGVDPATSMLVLRPPAEKAAILPRLQMISGAISKGVLAADASANALRIIGDHNQTLVTRDALKELAKSIGERPAFLFDALTRQDTSPTSGGAPELPQGDTPKNKGGRPPEYDWEAFTYEIIKIANSPDGLPDKPSELTARMQQWFVDTQGGEPAISTTKARITAIYNAIGKGRKPPQG